MNNIINFFTKKIAPADVNVITLPPTNFSDGINNSAYKQGGSNTIQQGPASSAGMDKEVAENIPNGATSLKTHNVATGSGGIIPLADDDNLGSFLQDMNKMAQGMNDMRSMLETHIMKHEENGVSLEVQGNGIIRNLQFPARTLPKVVESAINNANARVKIFAEQKMNEFFPPQFRDSQ